MDEDLDFMFENSLFELGNDEDYDQFENDVMADWRASDIEDDWLDDLDN